MPLQKQSSKEVKDLGRKAFEAFLNEVGWYDPNVTSWDEIPTKAKIALLPFLVQAGRLDISDVEVVNVFLAHINILANSTINYLRSSLEKNLGMKLRDDVGD